MDNALTGLGPWPDVRVHLIIGKKAAEHARLAQARPLRGRGRNAWLSNTTVGVGLTSSNLLQVLMVGTHQPGAASARPVSDTNRGIRSSESEGMK